MSTDESASVDVATDESASEDIDPAAEFKKVSALDRMSNMIGFVGLIGVAVLFVGMIIWARSTGSSKPGGSYHWSPAENLAPKLKAKKIKWFGSPVAGRPYRIKLAGEDSDGDYLEYSYRVLPQQVWLPAPDGTVTIGDPQPGKLDLEFRVVDRFGKASKPVKRSLTVLSPPRVAIADAKPANPKSDGTLTVELKGAGSVVAYQYRINHAAKWTESKQNTITIPNLAAGRLVVQVRSKDKYGLLSATVTRTWFVSPPNGPPSISITAVDPETPVAGRPLKISLDGIDPEADAFKFEYRRLPAGQWQTISGATIALPALSEGELKIEVRAQDERGEISKSLARSWTVRFPNRPPVITLAKVSPLNPKVGQPIVIQISGADADKDPLTFEIRLGADGKWLASKSSEIKLPLLSSGKRRLEFRARDKQGALSKTVAKELTVAPLASGSKSLDRLLLGLDDWLEKKPQPTRLEFVDAVRLLEVAPFNNTYKNAKFVSFETYSTRLNETLLRNNFGAPDRISFTKDHKVLHHGWLQVHADDNGFIRRVLRLLRK